MGILIILGHPDPDSFNHAIAYAIRDDLHNLGHNVMFHDLYAEGFLPLLPAKEIPASGKIDKIVEIHCTELSSADCIVIVHPNWWGQPAAILKGWVDRVFDQKLPIDSKKETEARESRCDLFPPFKEALT